MLEIIKEAKFEKDFHLIIHKPAAGVTFLLNNVIFEDSLFNPRNLPACYKYGLLIFDFGERYLKADAEYYASKHTELQSGIVIFSQQDIELNITNLKRHFLA